MKQEWMNRAALYELLAHAFLGTSHELVRAIISGEYSEAVVELGTANELDAVGVALCADELAVYQGRNADELFHELRIEHTRLFVGAPRPAVSPYAGIWWAHRADVKPLLFVNTESMAVERFYRSCGVGQPANSNEPLDHIGSELEFLQYLCLV
ncbi:MAG: molecular chaperone TorD family protein, partial [Coriobacteriales bacterium]|nr:molecular chaperone TorD family protein [Coriobacteriales bacterium]